MDRTRRQRLPSVLSATAASGPLAARLLSSDYTVKRTLPRIIAIALALAIMPFLFIGAILLLAASTAQAVNRTSPRCHRYDGRMFSGRIEKLLLRKSTKNVWSAEDATCDRFFFPAKLGSSVDVDMRRRITHDLNSHVAPSDDYVQLDAIVRINMDADRAGGVLTVIKVRSRAK